MKQTVRSKYKQRLDHLFSVTIKSEDDSISSSTRLQSDWAKYLCVLVSGYLEQSIKEIITDYATDCCSPQITRYIDRSWPNSKNMRYDVIVSIVENCNEDWAKNLEEWFGEDENRKDHLNSLIRWRNEISHGNDNNTNGVTRTSISTRWETVKKLVNYIESLYGLGK